MPITNYKCDFCEKVKPYVTEHYSISSGTVMEGMIHPVTGLITGKHKWICDDCIDEKTAKQFPR